jgi:hypothetical protein
MTSIASCSLYASTVSFTLDTPTTVEDKSIHSVISQSQLLDHITEVIDTYFAFTSPLDVHFGENDGPYFDPEENAVYIPYAFVSDSKRYFEKNDYESEYGVTEMNAALDTLAHTIFHEVAHAYIMDQQIPILGKEEDAADNLATLMLIENIEDGDIVAISAADMFAFESEDGPDYYDSLDYIGEHSFDLQRYFSTLCLVYGSDPEKHKHLLDEVDSEALGERKELCEEYFQSVQSNWHVYLKN